MFSPMLCRKPNRPATCKKLGKNFKLSLLYRMEARVDTVVILAIQRNAPHGKGRLTASIRWRLVKERTKYGYRSD